MLDITHWVLHFQLKSGIDLSQISDQNAEILLIGRISGVVVVEQLPS